MKINFGVNHLGLRLAFSTALIIFVNLGCLNLLPTQSVKPFINSNPILTSTIDLMPVQDKTLQPPTAGPGLSTNTPSVPLKTVNPSQDVVWEMLDQVDIDRAQNDLRLLTGETPICIEQGCFTIKNRRTGSEGLRWAKDYVYNELASWGYSVEIQDWSRSGYVDQNLIARKPGKVHPEEEIYFVAHLDGVGRGEERFPAADDNASGVVDLLELARVLSGYSFSHTVVLLFSTGEEQGTLGVKSYLDQLSPTELSAIKYVFNIDVIGYDANQDGVMELWHGDHSPSFDLATQVSQIIQTYQLNLVPGFVVGCG